LEVGRSFALVVAVELTWLTDRNKGLTIASLVRAKLSLFAFVRNDSRILSVAKREVVFAAAFELAYSLFRTEVDRVAFTPELIGALLESVTPNATAVARVEGSRD
jgi:hypothetical protein